MQSDLSGQNNSSNSVAQYWTTRSGEKILVEEMTDSHINNAVQYLIRQLTDWDRQTGIDLGNIDSEAGPSVNLPILYFPQVELVAEALTNLEMLQKEQNRRSRQNFY